MHDVCHFASDGEDAWRQSTDQAFWSLTGRLRRWLQVNNGRVWPRPGRAQWNDASDVRTGPEVAPAVLHEIALTIQCLCFGPNTRSYLFLVTSFVIVTQAYLWLHNFFGTLLSSCATKFANIRSLLVKVANGNIKIKEGPEISWCLNEVQVRKEKK